MRGRLWTVRSANYIKAWPRILRKVDDSVFADAVEARIPESLAPTSPSRPTHPRLTLLRCSLENAGSSTDDGTDRRASSVVRRLRAVRRQGNQHRHPAKPCQGGYNQLKAPFTGVLGPRRGRGGTRRELLIHLPHPARLGLGNSPFKEKSTKGRTCRGRVLDVVLVMCTAVHGKTFWRVSLLTSFYPFLGSKGAASEVDKNPNPRLASAGVVSAVNGVTW